MIDSCQDAEEDLGSLKSFASMAEEEYHRSLRGLQHRLLESVDRIDDAQEDEALASDAAGSAEVRWDIYSTWMLLLCLHHTEAEAQRCRPSFKAAPWKTEAQGLRRVFMRHRSVRILAAVLRWLRWSHHSGPKVRNLSEAEDEATDGGDASYERTRRALQLRNAVPQPLQAEPAMHPDGPLQRRDCFDDADLEDERRLLRQVFVHLRRGELVSALELCGARGQAWRTALLQGMMPFDDDSDAPIGYNDMVDDAVEDLLNKISEKHTDWTELGVLEGVGKSQGNPWRRLWKEQCWDVAQRNLKQGSSMDLYELSVYGFCAGNREALLAASSTSSSWADRCWAELHCRKEWLVERLLDIEREAGIQDPQIFPGEGDGGVPDGEETIEDRAARKIKLCGHFRDVQADQIERTVASEANKLLLQLREDPSTSPQLRKEAHSDFAMLQAKLIEAAWDPEKLQDALGMLHSWIGDDRGKPCPFLLKQFTSHFAIWMKHRSTSSSVEPEPQPQPKVDDIVGTHVGDIIDVASSSLTERCLEGHDIEIITSYVKAMHTKSRIETFVKLLLRLGGQGGRSVPEHEEADRLGVLVKCFSVYWNEFPDEVFELVGAVVKKALGIRPDAVEEMEGKDSTGINAESRPEDMDTAIRCLSSFWLVVRDKDAFELSEAVPSLSSVSQYIAEVLPTLSSAEDFARLVLELVVMPCLIDCLLCYAVKDVDSALARFVRLQDTRCWEDAQNAGGIQAATLEELQWYFILHQRRHEWLAAFKDSKAESVESSSRELLIDWARIRLARDQPLLEPLEGGFTTLAPQQWENLRRTLARRVIFGLLSVFEQVRDFDGASLDLSVAFAQSPWMLNLIRPELVRDFLQRVALIPTSLSGFQCNEPERPAALGWGPNLLST